MARCKAGEESEDKDTETDPGACTSQITWPVVTFSVTYIFSFLIPIQTNQQTKNVPLVVSGLVAAVIVQLCIQIQDSGNRNKCFVKISFILFWNTNSSKHLQTRESEHQKHRTRWHTAMRNEGQGEIQRICTNLENKTNDVKSNTRHRENNYQHKTGRGAQLKYGNKTNLTQLNREIRKGQT